VKRYYVYMLLCGDGSYYTGITNNLETRIAQHQDGADPHCYTFLRRPLELVYATEFDQPDKAISWEKQVKGWSRKKKKALVADNWDDIKRFARRVPMR